MVVARLAGPGIRGLGAVPLRELTRHIERSERVELFIDAAALQGSPVEESDAWALWLARLDGPQPAGG